MKKTKILSSLLSLSLAASLAFPGALAMPARADGEPSSDNSGIVVNKTATENEDGSGYTITLEAYATGSTTTSTVIKDVPTDIVLVLDQSGSMEYDMDQYAFRSYSGKTNGNYYDLRHNGAKNPNLWHNLDDGSYASVSVTKTTAYRKLENLPNYKKNNECYWKYKENLYEKVGDKYEKVKLEYKYVLFVGDRYTYTFANDTTVVSDGNDTKPNFGSHGFLYTPAEDNAETVYTYTYKDKEGETHTIGTSTGETTQPDFTLYERYESGSVTRLNALKTAVSNFADSVKTKAAGQDGEIGTSDDVNHRVAVVGFATGNLSTDGYPSYENTEVFIGADQYNYNSSASSHYTDALQDMNTDEGYNNVIASKDALAARGATYPNYGLEMAKGIFDENPVQQGEKRNRVVILFTDGTPGWRGYDSEVAGAAVTQAKALKNDGVTVYSVGIFEGADATSAGIADGASNRQANQFMQNVSSNNGTPKTPSYYLSASDAGTLNSIFKQISDQIQQGGSASSLGAEAVVKDIISPYFQLPKNATADNITLETYAYGTGGSWTKNSDAMGAHAKVNGTGEVEVTGFHFSENWCGIEKDASGTETPHGSKLVISFTVEPKPGFLGGNNVPTNGEASGVYDKDGSVVKNFDVPEVNVPIPEIKVEAKDKNVYLMGEVSAEQLKEGVTATCNGVDLLDKDTYTGEVNGWKSAFVNVGGITVKDTDGNEVTGGLSNLTEDGTYTFEVKVEPKYDGEGAEGAPATAQPGSEKANIYVFKPELTFQDSEVYYGETAPTTFEGNLTKKEWKHEGAASTSVTMTGTEPALDITYTPAEGKIENGKINSKQDIPVKAEVKINNTDVTDKTTFQHQACSPACGWTDPQTPGDPAFLLHVKTCQLTVTKTGGDANEPYVFTVNKDNQQYTEVTIVGNGDVTIKELPVGTYTIEEDTGWSWRYTPSYTGNGATLSKNNSNATITCTNTKDNDHWLNGFSAVARNIYGQPNSTGRRAK